MKENSRQDWKGVLVKFSVTKQEQTGEEDAVVPFVKNIITSKKTLSLYTNH